MPKKTKTEPTIAAAPDEQVTSATAPAEVAPEPKKPAAKKAAAKKALSAKAAAKKSSAKKSAKKTSATAATAAKQQLTEPTDEQIRMRAYFIAERRMQMRMDGDPGNDWIQAREELLAERGRNKPNGNGAH